MSKVIFPVIGKLRALSRSLPESMRIIFDFKQDAGFYLIVARSGLWYSDSVNLTGKRVVLPPITQSPVQRTVRVSLGSITNYRDLSLITDRNDAIIGSLYDLSATLFPYLYMSLYAPVFLEDHYKKGTLLKLLSGNRCELGGISRLTVLLYYLKRSWQKIGR